MTTRTYSTREAVDASGLKFRHIDWYVRRGYITPSIAQAQGSGSVRRWSQGDVDRLATIAARIAWGMTVEAAFRTVDPPLPAPPAAATTQLRSA